ncbi:hypothetical protein [Fervidicoccus sp.]|uniref:hypothetical protein n=1 Tax=Fervidicoccus sp. TaxID=2060324 RepID=UPI003D098EEF
MGIFTFEKEYNKNVSLSEILDKFSNYLKNNGWQVQQKTGVDKAILQARKGGILRDLFTAGRALTFTFEQEPEKLRVKVGIGNWIQNIAITTIETLFLSSLFLLVDIPEMLWNKHIEEEILKELDKIINNA